MLKDEEVKGFGDGFFFGVFGILLMLLALGAVATIAHDTGADSGRLESDLKCLTNYIDIMAKEKANDE